MTKIYIIGLTGGDRVLGGYETQLGNVAILIPAFKLFKQYIPDAEILTTLQLTDKFCRENGVTRIPSPKRISNRFLRGGLKIATNLTDFFRASLWRFIHDLLHINLGFLITGNRLKQFTNADLVLDFNGDIFPSDLPPVLVFLEAIEIVTIRKLGIPVIEFISSPGPFNTGFRRAISKFMYNRINLLLNREPVSSELVKQLGIDRPVISTACPAFLLEPVSQEKSKEILSRENVNINQRPLVGFTLAGYNLKTQRTWGTPKHFDDLKLYIPTLKYLLDDLNANVILLPHVYRMNPYTVEKEHINGPDHDLVLTLFKMLEGERYKGRLTIIEGKYTSPEAKGIVGQCDLYVTGRVHVGAAALSQGVPVVMLGYGHKHRGFARLFHQEQYVYEGKNAEELKSLVKKAWENRDEMTRVMRERMPRVRELVNLNFEVLKGIMDLDKSERNAIPKEMIDAWISRGEG